jgi:23S rRNA pseudouridine955/2504/2580 synthase
MNRIRKEVEHNLHGSGVLPFLRSQFNLKLRKAVQMIDEGRVEVLNSLASKGKPVNLGYKLCAGDVVQLHSKNELQNEKSAKKEVTIPKLEILYKDDHLLALNKPAGLAVQGGSKIHKSLENVLEGIKDFVII